MKQITLGNTDIQVPAVAIGCMRLTELSTAREVEEYIDFCLEQGANFFDHADIYGKGACERMFGEVLAGNPSLPDTRGKGNIHWK